MSGIRLRWGACAWLGTLQFFAIETFADLRAGAHSRADDVISDLGTAASPAQLLMNASFVVQGALILAGVVLLAPALRGVAGRAAVALEGAAAVGVLLVGVFPSDADATLHAVGAVLHLLGGGLGLIALAYALRTRSELLGTVLALLGLVGTSMTIFFFAGITGFLGHGGTERAGAYVVPIGLALAGLGLWRLGGSAEPVTGERPSRRELRARARADRARQEQERDAALEAAVRRTSGARNADPDSEAGDEPDADPWASPARRTGD